MQRFDPQFINEISNDVTTYIKDDAKINKLLDKRQFTPGQVTLAVKVALDRLYNSPPILRRLPVQNYPLHLILKAATIQLLETAQIVDVRNSLTYQDGGLIINDTHEGMYPGLLQYFSTFINELQDYKSNMNIIMSLTPMWRV